MTSYHSFIVYIMWQNIAFCVNLITTVNIQQTNDAIINLYTVNQRFLDYILQENTMSVFVSNSMFNLMLLAIM